MNFKEIFCIIKKIFSGLFTGILLVIAFFTIYLLGAKFFNCFCEFCGNDGWFPVPSTDSEYMTVVAFLLIIPTVIGFFTGIFTALGERKARINGNNEVNRNDIVEKSAKIMEDTHALYNQIPQSLNAVQYHGAGCEKELSERIQTFSEQLDDMISIVEQYEKYDENEGGNN